MTTPHSQAAEAAVKRLRKSAETMTHYACIFGISPASDNAANNYKAASTQFEIALRAELARPPFFLEA